MLWGSRESHGVGSIQEKRNSASASTFVHPSIVGCVDDDAENMSPRVQMAREKGKSRSRGCPKGLIVHVPVSHSFKKNKEKERTIDLNRALRNE